MAVPLGFPNDACRRSIPRNRTRTFSDNELRLVLKPPQPCLRGAAGLGCAGLGSASHFRGTGEYLVGTVAEASVPAAALGEGAPEAPRGEGGSGAVPPLASLPRYPGHPGVCPAPGAAWPPTSRDLGARRSRLPGQLGCPHGRASVLRLHSPQPAQAKRLPRESRL